MAYDSAIGVAEVRPWLDAGLAAHQSGDLERALSAYRQVLSVVPEHGPALTLAGTALLQLGQAEEAVSFLEHAARRERADANVLGNLAQAYLAVRRFADAAESFRKASRIAPAVPHFQSGLAAALALAGKLGEAERLLTRLTTRFPDSPLVWLNLGHVFRDTQRHEQAIEAYRKALALDAALIDARLSLGSVLHSTLRFDEARAEYEACIDMAPDHVLARVNLASLHMAAGRFPDAEAAYRDILLLAPERSEAHRLMGTAIAQQQRLSDALPWYERAVALAPNDAAAARTYGGALMEVGQTAEGLRRIAHALALEPDSVLTHRVVSGGLLACGRLQDGWIHYVHRPGAAELRATHKAWSPAGTVKLKDSQSRVCVIGEQGLGDELFFMRYVPQLVATGSNVTVRCDARLAPLLRRVEAFPEIVDTRLPTHDADTRVLCGDLPLALERQPQCELPRSARNLRPALRDWPDCVCVYWPSPAPSLVIPVLTERRAEILERLAALGPPPYIAVTWRGGVAPQDQGTDAVLFKSVDPEMLMAVLSGLRATVIAVQRNPTPGELDRAAAALGRPLHNLAALNDDLESMLALLAVVDEYIGVSNTNMHLRAAASRTARVLIPVPAEWRWMRLGDRSPWFAGFSIYRQSLAGHWTGAMSALKADLEVNYPLAGNSNSARI